MALHRVKNNKPPTKDEIKGRLIFGTIMLVAGIILLLFVSLPKYHMGEETKSWTATKGEITRVLIIAHKDGEQVRSATLEHHDGQEGIRFRLIPYYKYTVNSNTYTNSRVKLMENRKDGVNRLKEARKQAKEFENRTDLTVYFNPTNPEESLLEPGLSFGDWFFIIFMPLILFAAGIPLIYSALKHILKKTNER